MRALLRALAGAALVVALWHVAAAAVGKSVILPRPGETLTLACRLLTSREMLTAAAQTAWKVLLALSLAIAIGLPLGGILGLWLGAQQVLRPAIMVVQAVPVVSWLSLVIFSWGIGWRGPVFIAVVALLPMTVLTTASGVRHFDTELLEMARLYRVPRLRVARDIYAGSLLPFLGAVLEVGAGQAWKATLVAEYLSGGSGLGVKILMARMSIDSARVWAISLIAVALGLATEALVRAAARRLGGSWQPG